MTPVLTVQTRSSRQPTGRDEHHGLSARQELQFRISSRSSTIPSTWNVSPIGVNTMQNPQRLIAEYLYRAVKRPSIEDFMRIGDHAAFS